MNVDPSYARRSLSSMAASRLLGRSLFKALEPTTRSGSTGSLSTIEVIALIQAMNNQRGNQLPIEMLNLLDSSSNAQRTSRFANLNHLQRQQLQPLDRQLPVPVPVPTPFPIVVLFTAVAAFFAAVSSGLQPLIAVVAAFVAAYIAVLAIIVAIFSSVTKKGKEPKKSPLVKKLVIKKTVLPVVIPIPIKKKEIHYKYLSKPKHHHNEEGKVKHKNKYKKADLKEVNLVDSTGLEVPISKVSELISEQNQLQAMVDKLAEQVSSQSNKSRSTVRRIKRFVMGKY